jgi:hypothetical protein
MRMQEQTLTDPSLRLLSQSIAHAGDWLYFSNSGETPKVKVAEITAELRLSERNNILTKFGSGEIDV